HHLLGRLAHEVGLAEQPAALVLRLRADQDQVVVGAVALPLVHERLGVLLGVLAGGVQPDDQAVGDVGVVVLGDVDPVAVVLAGVAALQEAGLGLLLFLLVLLLLGLLVVLLLGRHRHRDPHRDSRPGADLLAG